MKPPTNLARKPDQSPTHRPPWRLFGGLGQVLLLSLGLAAQPPLKLQPVADATSKSNKPASNFGSQPEIGMSKDRDPVTGIYFMRAHVRFDTTVLSTLPLPDHADFYYYENRTIAAGGLPVTLHRLLQSWSETTITWQNQPSHAATVTTKVNVGDNFNRGWKKFDVTSLVQSWANGTYSNHGFVIRSERESTAGAYRPSWGPSRESTSASLRPYLFVAWANAKAFNKGCGPVATWPRLHLSSGLPLQGQSFTIVGTLLAANSTSLTAIGLSNTTWNGVPLPILLNGSVWPPCQLLVSPDVILYGKTTINGQQPLTLPVPIDPRLSALKVYFQMATGGSPASMTAGLEVTVY